MNKLLPVYEDPERLLLLRSQSPFGTGSGYVEGQTSQLANLARILHITVHTLILDIVSPALHLMLSNDSPRRPKLVQDWSRQLNGMNGTSEHVATTLEHLTGLNNLKSLTMIPLRGVIGNKSLLRAYHASCPSCYGEQYQKTGQMYDPLIWSFQDIDWCVLHQRRLQHHCPHCEQQFPRLSSRYQPGFCPNCNLWLGSPNFSSNASDEETNFSVYSAREVSKLIVKFGDADFEPQRAAIKNGIMQAVQKLTKGNTKRFCQDAEIDYPTFRKTLTTDGTLSLSSLLRICFHWKLAFAPLVATGEYKQEVVTNSIDKPINSQPGTVRRVDKSWLEKILKLEIESETPRSIVEIARDIGIHYHTIKRHFPGLYEDLKQHYADYKRNLQIKLNEDRKVAMEKSLEADPPISLTTVATNLGVTHALLCRLYPALSQQISARYSVYISEGHKQNIAYWVSIAREITIQLSNSGTYPVFWKIQHAVGANVLYPEIKEAWKDTLCELGYEV